MIVSSARRAAAAAALLFLLVPAGAPAATSLPSTAFPLQHVRVGSADLGYRVVGDAGRPPLVLVPGFAFAAAEWDPDLLGALAAHRRLIVFDNRGMGNSTGDTGRLSIGRMAADVSGLIRKLGLGRVDVLGWSMGGYIAQVLAIQRPERVRRLILASADAGGPHAIEPTAAVVAALENQAKILTVLFPTGKQAAGDAWEARIGAQPDLTSADFSTPGPVVQAQITAAATDWYGRGDGTQPALRRLRAKTLVAYGNRDVVVPPGNARIMWERLRRVTVRPFVGAGHAFLFQRPGIAGGVFDRFLTTG